MQKAKSISTLKLSTYTSTPYKIKNTHSESGQKNNYSVCSGGDDMNIIHQRSDFNIHYSFENPFSFNE